MGSAAGQTVRQAGTAQGKGPSGNPKQPDAPQSYKPVGANNPSVPNPPLPQQLPQDVQGMLAGKGNTATAQPGQQPTGQFDGTKGPMADNKAYPQSPFRQDGNTPYAPMGRQSDNYFGMYPKGQPQFGSNPYTPQTANLVGQPGHVKTMATGGNSSSGNVAMWQGATPGQSASSNQAFRGYTYNPTGGYYTNDAGQMFMPSYGNQGNGMGMMGNFANGPRSVGGGWYMTPIGGRGRGHEDHDSNVNTFKSPTAAPAAPITPNVYQQTYDYGAPQQAVPVNQVPYNGNIDAAGLPLFNAGGLTKD